MTPCAMTVGPDPSRRAATERAGTPSRVAANPTKRTMFVSVPARWPMRRGIARYWTTSEVPTSDSLASRPPTPTKTRPATTPDAACMALFQTRKYTGSGPGWAAPPAAPTNPAAAGPKRTAAARRMMLDIDNPACSSTTSSPNHQVSAEMMQSRTSVALIVSPDLEATTASRRTDPVVTTPKNQTNFRRRGVDEVVGSGSDSDSSVTSVSGRGQVRDGYRNRSWCR